MKKGDLALLSIDGIEINSSPKYTHKYMGPFEIIDALEHENYALKLPHYMKIHNIFHISKLASYTEPEATSFQAKLSRSPPVATVGKDNVFRIDRIVKHRFWGRTRVKQYLCKWDGYDATSNTWENATKILEDAPAVVSLYEKSLAAPLVTVGPYQTSLRPRRSTRKRT